MVFAEQLDIGRSSKPVSIQQVFLYLVIASKAIAFVEIEYANGSFTSSHSSSSAIRFCTYSILPIFTKRLLM
jgi:hypothetical protein